MLKHLVLLFLSICTLINALSIHGSKTLVLYDDRVTSLSDFSKFFNSLDQRSYQFEYISIGNETSTIDLYEKEQRLYDNLIFFPIKGKHLNRLVPVKNLLKFYEEGGDILAMTTPEAATDSVRLFLNELGIYPSPKDQVLIDYLENNSERLQISSRNLLATHVYTTDDEKNFIFEKSSTALLDNREQIVPILKAPRSSLTQFKDTEPWTVGAQGFLVAGFQNLNNARTSWIGSQDFFKNSNYKRNSEFVQELVKWTFREKSVIKSVGFSHSHIDGSTYEQTPYKVKDSISYEIGISQWTGEKWEPFVANDVQFELRLVDPYYRLTLTPSRIEESIQYYTTGNFKLPDHHGVFTFATEYKRNGLTFISESDIKTIRHLANDEYPRSWEISNAWVYISSIYGVIFSWTLFVIFFILTSSAKKITSEKKNN